MKGEIGLLHISDAIGGAWLYACCDAAHTINGDLQNARGSTASDACR